MDDDDDELFDDRDLMELIRLAAYLEGKAARGLFPKARYWRYSDALMRLIGFLAGELINSNPIADTADSFRKLLKPASSEGSAKILTHPRFRGRKK
jgi:hypothetical protein